jgi:hypothetical protein
VQGALACGDEASPIRDELIARRLTGERAIRRRLKQARAEGDLPPNTNPAGLARYLSALIYGMAVLAAGGASRRDLQDVVDVALLQWPRRENGHS